MIPPSFKNISEFPLVIQPLLTGYAGKLLKDLDDNVLSIIVYGSAAGINYNPAVSNINIAVIIRQMDFSVLTRTLGDIKWGRKHKISTPLFLTREYIFSSLDIFPIEFAEIKDQHKVIFGEDIFQDLDIPIKDVRLLCEQQVRGKLLRLQQAYLEIGRNPKVLKNLLSSALSDLVPVFRQLIILKGQKPLEPKEEMLRQLCGIFSLDEGPLLAVHRDRNKKILISSRHVDVHLQNFLSQLENLSRHLDYL